MELIRECLSLEKRFRGSALTIGNFDGIHLGHQQVLRTCVTAARERSSRAVVFTFDPHPDAILHPEHAPDRILGFGRKLELLKALGVDAVICPDGPLPVLRMPAEEFVREIIVGAVGAGWVVEGSDFAFGHAQKGDHALLERMGRELGFGVQVVPNIEVGGQPVSSTRIRRAIRQGRLDEARTLLGRPFEFEGRAVHGRHRGRGLGFPTVNLAGGDFIVPGDGVYAGWALFPDGESESTEPVPAAISVGREPTFGELPLPVVEAFLLDFDGKLYGRTVRLQFVQRIRDQQVFRSGADLREQVSRDCETIRTTLASNGTRKGTGPR